MQIFLYICSFFCQQNFYFKISIKNNFIPEAWTLLNSSNLMNQIDHCLLQKHKSHDVVWAYCTDIQAKEIPFLKNVPCSFTFRAALNLSYI